MGEVITKHQQTTFVNKDVIVRMSTLGAYIAIEFRWRANGNPVQTEMMNYTAVNAHPTFYSNNPETHGFMVRNPDGQFNQANKFRPDAVGITSPPMF